MLDGLPSALPSFLPACECGGGERMSGGRQRDWTHILEHGTGAEHFDVVNLKMTSLYPKLLCKKSVEKPVLNDPCICSKNMLFCGVLRCLGFKRLLGHRFFERWHDFRKNLYHVSPHLFSGSKVTHAVVKYW